MMDDEDRKDTEALASFAKKLMDKIKNGEFNLIDE